MSRQLGDRRTHIRLEVVGSLWGALDFEDAARVVNISDTGILIAIGAAPPADSVQIIRLYMEGREVVLNARVRHSRAIPGRAGRLEYLVGLELLAQAPVGIA